MAATAFRAPDIPTPGYNSPSSSALAVRSLPGVSLARPARIALFAISPSAPGAPQAPHPPKSGVLVLGSSLPGCHEAGMHAPPPLPDAGPRCDARKCKLLIVV